LQSIAISFTLKNQDFSKIKTALKAIKDNYIDEVKMYHCHMPREIVLEKGFTTEFVDMLDEIFPNNYSLYTNDLQLSREELVETMIHEDGYVYVVGSIIDGVKSEYELYKANISQNKIKLISLD